MEGNKTVNGDDIQIIGLNRDILDLSCKSGIHALTTGYYTTVNFILFTRIKCEVIMPGIIEDSKTAKEEILKIFNV